MRMRGTGGGISTPHHDAFAVLDGARIKAKHTAADYIAEGNMASHVTHRIRLNFARADMRRTEWVKANAATSDDPTAPIDLNDLFRRF